jgi:hypothetical protein
LTQATESATLRSDLKAIVYLKDITYFEQFKKVQTDPNFRATPISYAVTDQLASFVLLNLLEQIRR